MAMSFRLTFNEWLQNRGMESVTAPRTKVVKSSLGQTAREYASSEEEAQEEEEPSPPPKPRIRQDQNFLTSLKNIAGRAVYGTGEATLGAISSAGTFAQDVALGLKAKIEPETYGPIAADPQRRKEFLQQVHEQAGWMSPLIGMKPETKEAFEAKIEAVRAESDRKFPYSAATIQAETNDTWYKSPSWWLEQGGDVAANLVPAIGLSLAGSPAAGLAFMGLTAGGNARNESIARMRESGEFSEGEIQTRATALGALTGVAASVVSRLPLGEFIRRPWLKKAVFDAAAKNVAQTVTRQGAVKSIGRAFLGEATEEAIEGTIQDVGQVVLEKDPTALQGFWGRRAKEAALGGMAGASLRAGLAGVETSIEQISQRLQPEQKQAIANEIDRILTEPMGEQRLRTLGDKEKPTRKDFEDAGFDTKKLRIDANTRQWVASHLTGEMLDNARNLIESTQTHVEERAKQIEVRDVHEPAPPKELPPEEVSDVDRMAHARVPQPATTIQPEELQTGEIIETISIDEYVKSISQQPTGEIIETIPIEEYVQSISQQPTVEPSTPPDIVTNTDQILKELQTTQPELVETLEVIPIDEYVKSISQPVIEKTVKKQPPVVAEIKPTPTASKQPSQVYPSHKEAQLLPSPKGKVKVRPKYDDQKIVIIPSKVFEKWWKGAVVEDTTEYNEQLQKLAEWKAANPTEALPAPEVTVNADGTFNIDDTDIVKYLYLRQQGIENIAVSVDSSDVFSMTHLGQPRRKSTKKPAAIATQKQQQRGTQEVNVPIPSRLDGDSLETIAELATRIAQMQRKGQDVARDLELLKTHQVSRDEAFAILKAQWDKLIVPLPETLRTNLLQALREAWPVDVPLGATVRPALPKGVTEEKGTFIPAAFKDFIKNEGERTETGWIVGKALRGAKRLVKRAVFARGAQKQEIFEAKQQREYDIKTGAREAQFTLADFRSAIRKHYGILSLGELNAQDLANINAALKGEYPTTSLPKKLREPINTMRKHIDRLSRELVESGAIEGHLELDFPLANKAARIQIYTGIRDAMEQSDNDPKILQQAKEELVDLGLTPERAELIITVIANDGVYLNRSYRAFTDPNWAEKVDPATRNQAKAWLRTEFPTMTETEAERRIGDMLYAAKDSGSPMAFLSRTSLQGKDLSILKKRKAIAEPIRRLLGEETDPLNNYVRTVSKLTNLLSAHKMMETIRADGLKEKYLFYPDDPNRPTDANAQIATKASDTYAPLNGMMTYPEVYEEMRRYETERIDAPWYKLYMKVEGLAQVAKTAWSTQAMIRQIPSNMLIALSNGQMPYAWLGSSRRIATNLANLSDQNRRTYILDAIQYGIAGESVEMNTIDDHLKSGAVDDAFNELLGKGPASIGKKALRLPGQVYASLDTIFKMAAWDTEMARYRKAFPEWTEDQLKKHTAQIVRDTNPTYSSIPPVFKALKRTPLGLFISFQTEIVRNAANRARLTAQELKDPRTRKIGAARLTGQLTASIFTASLGMFSRYWLNGAEGEEKDRALREHVAPWSKYSTIYWLPRNETGAINYIDIGYSDPMGFVTEAVRAMTMEKGTDKFTNAALAILEPYIEPKLFLKFTDQAYNNTREDGTRIFNPKDTWENIFWARVSHVAEKALEPGTLKSARRIYKGLTGYVEPSGKTYDPTQELLAAGLGLRVESLNVPQSFKYDAIKFQSGAADTSALFTSVANREGTVTREELQKAYNTEELVRRRNFNEIRRKMETAVSLMKGYDWSENDALKVLREHNISEEAAENIIANRYVPYIPDNLDHLEKMMPLATEEHRALLHNRKEEILGSAAYSATGPATTGNSAQAAQKAQQLLEERGIPKIDSARRLIRRWKADEQERIKELLSKKMPQNIPNRDAILGELAKRLSAQRKFKWLDSRKERLQRLNLSNEEVIQIFRETGTIE